jgi:hypothetical protein
VHHALGIVAGKMQSAMNREAGRVRFEALIANGTALHVNLDERRRGDLVKKPAMRVDEKRILRCRPG